MSLFRFEMEYGCRAMADKLPRRILTLEGRGLVALPRLFRRNILVVQVTSRLALSWDFHRFLSPLTDSMKVKGWARVFSFSYISFYN